MLSHAKLIFWGKRFLTLNTMKTWWDVYYNNLRQVFYCQQRRVSFQPLTVITKWFILDASAVLDPSLLSFHFYENLKKTWRCKSVYKMVMCNDNAYNENSNNNRSNYVSIEIEKLDLLRTCQKVFADNIFFVWNLHNSQKNCNNDSVLLVRLFVRKKPP